MQVTEVLVKLVRVEQNNERVRAFCSITLDGVLVVRDVKVIEGAREYFVAMPSRKIMDHCSKCKCKNHLQAGFCNRCGARLNRDRADRDAEGRLKLYADVAHPITAEFRAVVQDVVLRAFIKEQECSKQPGYVSSYDAFLGS